MKTKLESRLHLKTKTSIRGFTFIVPFLIGFALFTVIPFVWSLYYSLTSGVGGKEFVGLQNYHKLLESAAFRLAVYNTGRFLAIGVPLLMIISFLLALLFDRQFKGSAFFRSVFLTPLIVPISMLIVVMNALFSGDGVLNKMFASFDMPTKDWLQSESAFWILVVLFIWKNCGYNIILFLVGLGRVPQEVLDAASLEGANSIQKLFYVKIPLISPITFFVFIISIVNSFKIFREAYALGGEAPHESIYMLQHFLNNNFKNLNYQRLSGAAFLVFLAIAILVLFLFWQQKKGGGN